MITMPSFDISYVVNSTFDNKTSQVDTSTCLKQINLRKVKQPASNMDFINSIPTHMVIIVLRRTKKQLCAGLTVYVIFKDFEGQARAERISRIIITLFGIVGLVWGYIIQQFSQTVYILGAGFLLASLVIFNILFILFQDNFTKSLSNFNIS